METKKDEPFIFKPGDRVKIEGVLEERHSDNYPLQLVIAGHPLTFTRDGKYGMAVKEPMLQLVERPKKKVKKYRYAYVVKSELVESKDYYIDNEDFLERSGSGWKEFQRLDFTEIEVEEA